MAKPKPKPKAEPGIGFDDESVDLITRTECEESLRAFTREAWPVVVPAEQFQDNWHVSAICEHLEAMQAGQIQNLLINIPPRFGKSTIVSVMFPAWLWVQDPTLRLVYSSYAQSLSTRDSLATRQLIDSPWYQSYWSSRFAISEDQNEKTRFQNDKKGFRLATSVGGVATGEGGDYVVVDDPHNVNEVESELVRQGVLNWWNVTMPSRSGRGGVSKRVVIMQRVHEMDLAGDIISKGTYEHLNLPMEFERKTTKVTSIGWADPRKEDGELLWPARFTRDVIKRTLAPPNMTSVAYAAQYQQRPAPAEGGMFLRKWWKFHKMDAQVLIDKAHDRCWSWDMAFKDLKESDFVCGTGWCRIGPDFYLLPHAVHDKLTFSASKMAVKSCSARFPRIAAKLVEDKANGTAIIDDLKTVVGGLIPFTPEESKEARASVVQPYAEAGNIYLPEPSIAPWVESFIEEFRVFPNGAHDDWVDSTSQAVVWLLNRYHNTGGIEVSSVTKSTARSDQERPYYDPRYS